MTEEDANTALDFARCWFDISLARVENGCSTFYDYSLLVYYYKYLQERGYAAKLPTRVGAILVLEGFL